MESYKNWVRRNRDYIHSLESLANGLTWLLPERFSSSEIGPEAVTSMLGIITTINQHIIDTTPMPTQWPMTSVKQPLFPYSLCISALKEVESLVEVIAEQLYGEQKKWDFVAAVEASKAFLRLALFRESGYKMLLHGGETPNDGNDFDDSDPQKRTGQFKNAGVGLQNPGYLSNQPQQNPWNFEGRAVSALSRFGENARMIYGSTWANNMAPQVTAMQPQNSQTERQTITSMISKKGFDGVLFLLGETMFILRPLIYVLFIRKYGTRSWMPWVLSLAIDFAGTGALLRHTRLQHRQKEPSQIHLSVAEKDELKRRKVLWALYLMRDPFFSNYTRRKLERTQKLLEPVPVIGLLSEKILELIFGAQTRYFYMSGS